MSDGVDGIRAHVEQVRRDVLMSDGGLENPIVGKKYWIRRSHRDEHAELWKCDFFYVSESGERRYLFVNVDRRTEPWFMPLWQWDDLRVHGRCWADSGTDAHMAQANPYTVATGSFGDVLRKYKHAISNTDDVPAQWADIPEEPQKWKLEELGRQLTNMSRYNIVQWAKSRNISLKGLDETVEDWWNRLTRASRIELWQYARDWMVVTGNNITTRWSVQNFFRHKQWNLPPSEWLGAPKHEHVQEHVPKNWAEIPMADQWPIQRVLRDERAWCMAHGIPAPPQVMGAPMVSDTDENWFTYRDFRKWWFHLTPTQRWLLWQKRGGSSTWEPPDLEKEKRHYEKSQAALKKIKSENFDYNAPC